MRRPSNILIAVLIVIALFVMSQFINTNDSSIVTFKEDIVFNLNDPIDFQRVIETQEFDEIVSINNFDTSVASLRMPLFPEFYQLSDSSREVTNASRFGSELRNSILRVTINKETLEYNLLDFPDQKFVIIDDGTVLVSDNKTIASTPAYDVINRPFTAELVVRKDGRTSTHRFEYNVRGFLLVE